MTDVQIECFLSVCETLNFTATATKMFYTPQGVSKLISTLEDELELTLFERDKQNRPLRITPAGQYCRENLMARQRRFTRIMGEIHGWYQQLSRHFRLGISEWVDPYSHDMAKVLLGFRQEHPDLVFEAVFDSNDSLLRRAEAGELDAVIISGGQHFPGNDLESEPLARERISVVVPEYVCGADWGEHFDPNCWGVPFVQGPVKTWGRLESEQVIRKELSSMGLFPSRIVMMPNVSSLSAALLLMRCVTVTDIRFGHTRRLPRLRYFPVEQADDAVLLCMWSLRNENPRVREFITYARESLGDGVSLAGYIAGDGGDM